MSDTSKGITRRLVKLTSGAALLAAAAACGNVTVGGFSDVYVNVSGDVPDPVPAPAAAPAAAWAAASGPSASPGDADDAEGEVEVDLTLDLVWESGALVSLGEDDIRIKLDLRGVDKAEAVHALVPSGRYTGLRISFTHIKVEVSGGLVINGQPIMGEVHVELEDPELVVTRPLDLEAMEGSAVELLVDLNTRAWLDAVDPVTLTVDPAVFAALINLVVP